MADLKKRLRELADDYRRDAPSLLDVLACEAAVAALEEAEKRLHYQYVSADHRDQRCWEANVWDDAEQEVAALRASLTEGE